MSHYVTVSEIEYEDDDQTPSWYRVVFTCDDPTDDCHLVCEKHEEYPHFERGEDGIWRCIAHWECEGSEDGEPVAGCDCTECGDGEHSAKVVASCNTVAWLSEDHPYWVEGERVLREGTHEITVSWSWEHEGPEWSYAAARGDGAK